jgi:hypothetical protein
VSYESHRGGLGYAVEVRDGRDRVVLIQCHAGDLTRQRSNAASSDGQWKIGFSPGAMTVVIAVSSAARATAESTTSSRSVILVVRHVAAGVSKSGGVVDVHSISINSVALRSATCSRCERASRGPVLLVRQYP